MRLLRSSTVFTIIITIIVHFALDFVIDAHGAEIANWDDLEPIDVVYVLSLGGNHELRIPELPTKANANRAPPHEDRQDWTELRYSLRSLSRFAPWVRRIYLAFDTHSNLTALPSWLQAAHPAGRLAVVTPDQLLPDFRDKLSSVHLSVLEANVHRIPDLSSRFILMSDHHIVVQNILKSALMPSPYTHYVCLADSHVINKRSILRPEDRKTQSTKLLNAHFGYKTYRDCCDAPQVIDIELMQDLQATFPDEFGCATSRIDLKLLYSQWVLQTQPGFAPVSRRWYRHNVHTLAVTADAASNQKAFVAAKHYSHLFVAVQYRVPNGAGNAKEIAAQFTEFFGKWFPYSSPAEHPVAALK